MSAANLTLLLRSRWDPAALDELRARGDLDWDALVRAADEQRVTALLYAPLRGQAFVPAAAQRALQEAGRRNGFANLVLFHALEEALRALQARGVPAIVLKGAALAQAVYADLSLRPMGDLDLLVRPEHAAAAIDAALALGYTAAVPEAHPGDTLEHENELLLRRPGLVDTALELHWHLLDSPYYQHALPVDWFWSSARPLAIGEFETRMLGPEAQVLHLCAHLCLHHAGAGLLWWHDVAELLVREEARFDWPLLLERAQSCELVMPLQYVLPRSAADWRAPVPAGALARLAALEPSAAEQRVFAWLTAGPRPTVLRFWADLRSMPGWSRRARYALTSLFPSPEYMRWRYRIRHAALLPLYYPYRWFDGLRAAIAAARRAPAAPLQETAEPAEGAEKNI